MSGTHSFHPSILREYDIRGIVGQTLDVDDARAIGRAFGSIAAKAGGRTVCVGYDGRLSSLDFEAAVAEGLAACGLEVWRIGRGPTPMLYYATGELGADAGIMVTGSHNPPDHNGFKMTLGGRPFFGADVQALGRLAVTGGFVAGRGTVAERPVFEPYVARLLADFRPGRSLAAVWDPGNGAAGEVAQALAARLPGRHVIINGAVDGTFPAHHPDPTEPANLAELQDRVLVEQADLGLAFDGDGDRLGVVDGLGRILWADQLMVLFAEEVLAEQPGAPIIADVKSSQVLFDEISRMGGKPLMWRTGHSLVKAKMAETGAPLAGEMSGHIFFADRWYGFDDALYAAIRLLGILGSWSHETLAARYDRLPHMVNTPEMRFPCADDRKLAVVDEVKARLRRAGAELDDIDGVRVRTADGWWLLRASNTQAVLVARCEAGSVDGLKMLRGELGEQLRLSGVVPPGD